MKISELIAQCGKPFYSVEFFPPKEKDSWPAFLETAGRLKKLNPLFASVTYGAGGGTQDNTLEIAMRLKEIGLNPMPHLTCVGATPERLIDFIRRLKGAGIANLLALRGDPPKDAAFDWKSGEFSHASDLVAFVRKNFPELCIGVAGYPTAHPESTTFHEDRRHTKEKLDAGSDFVVTQLFFDVREYIDFVARLKEIGINKPVLPGVLPVQSFESLRRVLSLSGATISGKLYLSLEEANAKGGPAAVKDAGIAFAVEQIRRLFDAGAPGVHLYTLNMASTCLRIAEEVGPL